jgi:DNA-binding MarR family transcriptional regulator
MAADPDAFDLETFLPYVLNQAAEATSRGFHAVYRDRYGMTRTQWRVLANLGKFGAMTASEICAISHVEKTKVSRSVSALEAAGMLSRARSPEDRRAEILALTEQGRAAFAELGELAKAFDRTLREMIGPEEVAVVDTVLRRLRATAPQTLDKD